MAAENVTFVRGNSKLKSGNLQSALDDELAIDLTQLLPGSTWHITNKTSDRWYKNTRQVTFDTEPLTVNSGKFAAAGLFSDYSVGDACPPTTPISYEIINNSMLYVEWRYSCGGVGGGYRSATITVFADSQESVTMIGLGGDGAIGIGKISIS